MAFLVTDYEITTFTHFKQLELIERSICVDTDRLTELFLSGNGFRMHIINVLSGEREFKGQREDGMFGDEKESTRRNQKAEW